MKNLKVLMIGPGVPDAQNSGLGIVAEELRKALSTKVSLLSIEPGQASSTKKTTVKTSITEEEVVQDLVRVSVTDSLDTYSYFEPTTYFDTENVSSKVKKKYDEYTEAVVTKAKANDFDIIYVHDWVGMEAAMLLQEESQKPMVIHVHSLDVDRLGVNHKSWVYDIEYSAIQKADAIISVSQYTKDKIVQAYQGDPTKITVVHPALPEFDRATLKSKPHDPTVLFLGRFANQKRPLKFVEIAEQVIKKNNQVHFLMVGDGDLKEQAIEKVAQKSLGDKIHFADYVKHDELAKVFARTSILCITSDSEPFGLTALEAAAAEIPVILSAQSGAAEVLSGAILVDKDDVKGFAGAINNLLNNKKEIKKVVEANKLGLNQLDWDIAARNIAEVFQNVLK